MKRKTPTPGSDAAVALGCSCPVLDNDHGRGAHGTGFGPKGERVFWRTVDCKVHRKEKP